MEDFQESLSPMSSWSSLSSDSPSPNPDPLSIDGEIWLIAEQRTQEILCSIQATVVSEQVRKEVIDHVQRLIEGYYGTEVFPFGSVPLKTYLPDGDIDLSAVSHQIVEEDLARGVCSILEGEEKDSEFQVKDVHYIHAQVKIVKCTVKGIAVDISFNQVDGLCTLCFLEQVDQFIGKDHLFKRSIILIKAWCYYESRILGAHHGLISTYALETMVLYIINLYHASLRGPLEVLYRFLGYYSTFDWDSYCISVNGPVAIYSLSEIVGESLEDDKDELLLSKEFLRNCKDIFSVPTRAHEYRIREFPIKHLNIVDPLKDNNNLGRSVNKGNFHRIISALSYGAQKLGEVFMLPGESMGERLENFFINTLARNGRGLRRDVQVPIPAFGSGGSEISDLGGDYDSYYSSLRYGQQFHDYTLRVPAQPSPSSPSLIWDKSAWEALAQSVRRNWNLFYQRGTDVFVPRLPLHRDNASQQSNATLGFEDMEKSRGTGTYIPYMTCHPNRDTRTRLRARYSKYVAKILLPKAPQKSYQTEVPSETDKSGNGCCPNLSLEEFPLLKGTLKPTPSETHQSGQLTVKSPKANDYSPIFGSIVFGTYGQSPSPSPLRLPLTIMNKQANSAVSTSSEFKRVNPTKGMQRQQQSWESDQETFLAHPFLLKNENDFPPLSM